MSPRNSLKIVLRIPVRIKNNNHSRFRQVDPEPSSLGRQQKNSKLIVLIKPLNTCDAILTLDSASEHLASHLFVIQKIFYDIYHSSELTKH